MSDRIDELKRENDLEWELSELQEEVYDLEEQINDLEWELSGLRQEIYDLEDENADLERKIEDFALELGNYMFNNHPDGAYVQYDSVLNRWIVDGKMI